MANFEREAREFSELTTLTCADQRHYPSFTGLFETIAADQPAFNAGLIIERASTNEILHSRDLSNAAWSVAGTGTRTQSETGLDGVASSAMNINDTDGAATFSVYQDVTISANSNTNVASIYIKKEDSPSTYPMVLLGYSGGSPSLSSAWAIDTENGTATNMAALGPDGEITIEDNGLLFWRVSIKMPNNGSHTAARLQVSPAINADASATANAASTGGVVVDFAQFETLVESHSSAIITGAAAVERANVLAHIGGFSDWGRADEFTLYCEYSDLKATHGGGGCVVSLYEDGGPTRVNLSAKKATNQMQVTNYLDGTLRYDYFDFSESGKFAATYSVSRQELIISLNGETATRTGVYAALSDILGIGLGRTYQTTVIPNSVTIKDVRFYPSSMSDPELAAMTA